MTIIQGATKAINKGVNRVKHWASGRTADYKLNKQRVAIKNYQKTQQAIKDGTMTVAEAKKRGTYKRPQIGSSPLQTAATLGAGGLMAYSMLPSSHRDEYEAEVKEKIKSWK